MKLFIVTEDLGDGDVGLCYFSCEEAALKYMEKNQDWTFHESNPHEIDTENFKFEDE